MKNNKKKGFTLMELLIVVAIIVVLIAIMIPVLSGQLDKSKRAADAANVRAAYSQVMAQAVLDPQKEQDGVAYANGVYSIVTDKMQADAETDEGLKVGDFAVVDGTWSKGQVVKVSYNTSSSTLSIAGQAATASDPD